MACSQITAGVWSTASYTSLANGTKVVVVGSSADALASTANFLKNKGWKRGQGFHEGEPNFAALLEWNAAPVYAKTIVLFADRLSDSDAQ